MSYKGSQKTNTRAHAITEDDYADDDEGYDRYQSYDYEGDYEDEELEEQLQDMKAEQEKGGETNIAQVAISQDEKKLREQLAREKAEQDVANSEQNKKRLKEEAEAAREFLIEEGIQVPEFSDESIIAMYKRIFNRRQAQQQDLMVVSSSVPSAEVNFEDMEVEFFVDSTSSAAAGGAQNKDDEEQPRKKKSVAAIVLPDEYPEQPAQVFVKNGRYLERFARAVLRNMSSSQYSYKPQYANKKADSPTKSNNNNDDDDDDDDLGMLESAKSSEPVFLSDVCRFIQKMVDLMYLPNSPLQAAVEEESSKQAKSSSSATNSEAKASAEAGFVAGEIPETVREQAFLNICSREWAALTADHFTLKAAPKAKLVIQAKPKPKNDTKDDDDEEKSKKNEADDEEELFQLRRRRCLTAHKPKPKAKVAPRPVAVVPKPTPVRTYYDTNPQTTFLNRLTEANENNSEFFTFGTALNAPLTDNICKLKNLRYLDLHGARLTAIPNQLQELRIEKLILGKNSLKSFPKAILGLRSLRILDLSWNSLTQIPSGVGKLTELRVLELSHNKIESLCSFEHLKKLEVLDVTDNNLSGLPAEVGNLKNLWLLHIRGNPMVQIPLDIYYKGIDEIKNFLSQSSTKNLPVPPSTINEDLGYLHLQIPGNEHLRESIFGGVVPEKYVPGAGDENDDYSAVVGEEQSELEAAADSSMLSRKSPLLSIYYREKKVEVTTDSTTGASSINTIVSETPRILFKTFKWLLAARVPLLVEQEFSSSSSTKFILPEPLHEVEANLFAAFVLAPSSPFIVTNFNENNRVACLRLVSQYTRERSRKNGLRHLSQSANEIIGFSESLAHWVPVCCGDDLAGQLQQISANRQTDGDLEGTQDEITQHLNDVINQNKLLSNLAAAGESQDPDIVSFIVGEERQRFYGHKSLLALRSGFFRTLFLDNMSGNNSSEVVIDDVEPSVFAALITFLYTDSHGKKMTNDNVVDLLFLSARYEVPRLRAMSECMVGFNVEIENVCRVLQMAYFLQSQRLKEACVMFVVSNRFNVEVTADYQELQDEIREEISEKIREFKLKRK